VKKAVALSVLVAIATIACDVSPADGKMVLVSGGTFDMGVAGGTDNPLHRVMVAAYWISPFELTAGEWREFTDAAGGWPRWDSSEFKSLVLRPRDFRIPDDWPIYWISWYEAVWYCNWRSVKEGLAPAYEFDEAEMREHVFGNRQSVRVGWNQKADGYRLPTEAEWEFVARSHADGEILDAVGWYYSNSEKVVHSVGGKAANPLGLHDLLGNVSEWCWDYYRPDYYSSSPSENPTGPDGGSHPELPWTTDVRVARGGHWLSRAPQVTPTTRVGAEAWRHAYSGLRLARGTR
jgi:formylglycine-generating enzyme required for sulfatase activity